LEVLAALANQHDCLLVHVPGRVGLVLDHETLQRGHVLLEHGAAYLLHSCDRLGSKGFGLVFVVSFEEEELVDLFELRDASEEGLCDVVGVNLAKRQRRFLVFLLQMGPDGRLGPDVQERQASQHAEVDGSRQDGRLDWNEVDAQGLER